MLLLFAPSPAASAWTSAAPTAGQRKPSAMLTLVQLESWPKTAPEETM